jgi:hypothetical protein
MRRVLLAAGVIGLALAAILVTRNGGTKRPSPPAPLLASATVHRELAGSPLPQSFLGLSQEYTLALPQVGPPESSTNPVLVALYDNLARFGSGVPTFRVGGGTTDTTWFGSSSRRAPRGATYRLTDRWLAGVGRFLKRTGAPAILGLNLAADDRRVATDWARRAQAALSARPPLRFELGNEPDTYGTLPVPGASGPGAPTIRPKGYGLQEYLPEAARFVRALRRLHPSPLLAGPAFACKLDCTTALPRVLRSRKLRFDLATVHRYPLTACRGGKVRPTIASLLATDTNRGPLHELATLAASAKRAGVRLRVTETNSVSCGGAEGVSNVFAAALWGADWIFGLQVAGIAGADFHGSSPLYAPFQTRLFHGTYLGVVKPLYYGMLLFAEATAHRSRPVFVQGAPVGPATPPNLKLWAFEDRTDGVVRVALINKELSRGGTVRISVPGAAGRATVKRLLAPGPDAKQGITWGGQGFAVPTPDGRLTGRLVLERVRRDGASTFAIRMPEASAALLTVPVDRKG